MERSYRLRLPALLLCFLLYGPSLGAQEIPQILVEAREEFNFLQNYARRYEQYRVAHIMCASREQAMQALLSLKNGNSFAHTAAQFSIDNASRDKGGELDWSRPQVWSVQFAQAVQALQEGQTSVEPVQTEYGWHILHLLEKRALRLPPFYMVQQGFVTSLEKKLALIAAQKDAPSLEKLFADKTLSPPLRRHLLAAGARPHKLGKQDNAQQGQACLDKNVERAILVGSIKPVARDTAWQEFALDLCRSQP